MKYCKNCGMLLEDTHEHCIGCGIDVTKPENVSKYPPEMQKTIESQKKESKAKTGIVGAIIVVFVLLIALVGVIIVQFSKRTPKEEPAKAAESTETVADTAEEEPVEEEPVVIEDAAEPAPADDREIADERGSYYNYIQTSDAGGNVVFSTLYPEDFTAGTPTIDYEKCSTKFPEFISFVAGNVENTARFTYMSPQQFWYKESETGKSISNERDTMNYMSFLSYGGAEEYIKALIKQGYKDAKKINLIETTDADEVFTKKLEELSTAYTKTLTGDIGDYAHIGANTTYATMESEFSVKILKYEITTKDASTLFCEFCVPIMANHFYYANDDSDDRGTVTEWIALSVMGFEAGNQELYDQYTDDFYVFARNTRVNQNFYYINSKYGAELEKNIEDGVSQKALDAKKLEEYKKSYKASESIGALNQAILEYSELREPAALTFSDSDQSFIVQDTTKQVYFDKTGNKVFITPDEAEYPGSSYTELKEES